MHKFATTAFAGAFMLATSGAVLAQAAAPAAPSQPSAPATPRYTPDQVRQGLTAMGYTDVAIVSQQQGAYVARAKRAGRDVSVTIDADGEVREQPAD